MLLTCSRCNQDKPESEFRIDRKQQSGRCKRCKECVWARRKAKEARPDIKRCSKCRNYKPLEEYKAGRMEYGSCKQCRAAVWGGRCRHGVRGESYSPSKLARRLRERRVTQAEWDALRDASLCYANPKDERIPDEILSALALPPARENQLCSLTICIGESLLKGDIEHVPEDVGKARALADLPYTEDTREEAA